MEVTQENGLVKHNCVCNEVPVEEIVRYLRNDPILVGYRLSELAALLNIPTENSTQFEPNAVIRDRLAFIIQMWISLNGSNATVEAFISILLEMQLRDLAERLAQSYDNGMKIVNIRSCKCAQSSSTGNHSPTTSPPPLQPLTYNAQQHFGASSTTTYQVAYQQQSAFAVPADELCGMFNQKSFQINNSSSDKVKFYLHQGSAERDMATVERMVATTLPRDAVDELECSRVRAKKANWYSGWFSEKKENKVPAPLKVKMKTKKSKKFNGLRFNVKTVTAFMRENPLCKTFDVKVSENPDTSTSSGEFDVEAQTTMNYGHQAAYFPNSYMQ